MHSCIVLFKKKTKNEQSFRREGVPPDQPPLFLERGGGSRTPFPPPSIPIKLRSSLWPGRALQPPGFIAPPRPCRRRCGRLLPLPPPWGSIPAAARPNLTPAGDCTGAPVCVDRVAPSDNCPCSVNPTHTVIMLLSRFTPIPTLFVHQQSLNYAKRTCQPHPLSCRGRRTPGYGVEENGGNGLRHGTHTPKSSDRLPRKKGNGFPPPPTSTLSSGFTPTSLGIGDCLDV